MDDSRIGYTTKLEKKPLPRSYGRREMLNLKNFYSHVIWSYALSGTKHTLFVFKTQHIV
jgi:hypothetical protein